MRKKSFYDSEPGHWSATNPRACRVSGSPWPCGPASRSSASSWSPTASVLSTPTWGPKANSTAARGRISATTTHVSGRSPFQPVTQVGFFWRFFKKRLVWCKFIFIHICKQNMHPSCQWNALKWDQISLSFAWPWRQPFVTSQWVPIPHCYLFLVSGNTFNHVTFLQLDILVFVLF